MIVLGISEGFHNAAVCYLKDNIILHASESERFSKIKNDKYIHPKQINLYKNNFVAYYEKSWLKNLRRILYGQSWLKSNIDFDKSFYHHESHAAAGFYTAPFDDCNILVIDSIGEFDTVSIWDNMNKIKSWKYPRSLGLLYSAVTQKIGFKPNEEEYITMGVAAYGEPKYDLSFLLNTNNHRGLPTNFFPNARKEDLAASVQKLYEQELLKLIKLCPKKNLILAGGCALNCVANSKIKNKNIWILPAPGDAGSAIGAAALVKKQKIKWQDPYLGYEIQKKINPKKIVNYLLKNKVVGVANGKAEFGPRALGNRSLLADPRLDIKDYVNKIKNRQKFRPFSPAILEEFSKDYFDGPMNAYMNFVAKAKHDLKSVTHVDGTARVQVVHKNCSSILRKILEEWYNKTKCPMLLNTSLNIKGHPIVNDEKDAKNFSDKYKIKVY